MDKKLEIESIIKDYIEQMTKTTAQETIKIKIEKDVPISVKHNKTNNALFEIFAKMEVGDSILVPFRINGSNVQNLAAMYKTQHKKTWNYTTRTQPDEMIRLWRIKV